MESIRGQCVYCKAPCRQQKMIKGFTCEYSQDGKKRCNIIWGVEFSCQYGDCSDIRTKIDDKILDDMDAAYFKKYVIDNIRWNISTI